MSCNFIQTVGTFEALIGDEHINNVLFLAHFNETSLGGVTKDLRNHSFTFTGTTRSATQARFGRGLTLVGGSADVVLAPEESIRQGDFTLECFFSQRTFIDAPGSLGLIELSDANATGIQVKCGSGNRLQLWVNGVVTVARNTAPYALSGYHHVAITRKDGIMQLWQDGVQAGSAFENTTDFTDTQLNIGRGGSVTRFSGDIDEVRYTKGVARYTEQFSVPTEQFLDY